mmetsp:Transcript_14548/g.40323  ORF Transcript_14548/g.40323 Transcript_14548/m.40323 type:complete len:95 (+) Transcript_14548:1292-1576(+)
MGHVFIRPSVEVVSQLRSELTSGSSNFVLARIEEACLDYKENGEVQSLFDMAATPLQSSQSRSRPRKNWLPATAQAVTPNLQRLATSRSMGLCV